MKKVCIFLVFALLMFSATSPLFARGSSEAQSNEPVKLTLYMPGPARLVKDVDMVEGKLAEYTIPKINASLDINFIGWGEWTNKKSLMIASGEGFDIGFTAIWDDFENEVVRNAWLPLNSLIDNHASSLYEVVGDFLIGPTVDGKIYAIPTVKEIAYGNQFLANKKYIDKYNIDITTIKSFSDAERWMKVIKENEPGIAGWFVDAPAAPGTYYLKVNNNFEESINFYFLDKRDMKIKHRAHIDTFWEGIEMTRRWYKEGYFQNDLEDLLISSDYMNEMRKGNFVFYLKEAHPGKVGEMTGTYGFEFVGSGALDTPVATRNTMLGSMMAISRTSKHPEEAIKMLELMNTDPYVNNLINYGIEGLHWDFVDKSNNIIKIAENNNGYTPNMTWALQNQFLNYLREYEDPAKWDKYKEFNDNSEVGLLIGFSPDVSSLKTEVAAVENVDSTYRVLLTYISIIFSLQKPVVHSADLAASFFSRATA
jgi:putative aldouronate transport system substrate-binding protein